MLIGTLNPGPVDVIGDVHGELEVLTALLARLGCVGGRPPAGRTLVFLGDLVDRGPSSLGVVDLVRDLVADGRAQCVLGNHELNILRDAEKDGSAWFFKQGLPAADRTRVQDFFATLPVALERDDLRVVHACWHDEHVATLRAHHPPLVELSQRLHDQVESSLGVLTGVAADVYRQNAHPIKVLTSGLEEPAKDRFFAGGKWRLETRTPWWNHYDGTMCVVGHYWRSRTGAHHGKGPDLFAGTDPLAPLGRGNVMCVDYSIGKRAAERAANKPFDTALAAYRWPERELVFAD